MKPPLSLISRLVCREGKDLPAGFNGEIILVSLSGLLSGFIFKCSEK